eukprot:TRINITY_DN4498_c0_g1_i1.p1 TRINITY_DN4498_c0_g1~~TRINITY_DN4498_c0_g1_i1.p1  ORF type:complete len:763 (-),score=163.79 TRINITY_DN4498_c0_g1_i1:884-3139(-)
MADGDQGFGDLKKGEVAELRQLLRDPRSERDGSHKRDTLKRVVAYMTMGIDMSRLFSDMIIATGNAGMVEMKMVYLYLCNYAEMNEELAVLAINTLLKGCNDSDPLIRGLALRNLCSLRTKNIVEYIIKPLQNGLRDPIAYVRKTAVLGCVKMFHVSPKTVRDLGIVNRLYEMLRDKDPAVISNCVMALNEILYQEGGMAVNKLIIYHLLNKIRTFNDWGQVAVLETLLKYTPENEDDVYELMNLLDERLSHANSAVVMAAARAFLQLVRDLPHTHSDVFNSIKEPIYTMLGSCNELAYALLENIRTVVAKHPSFFAPDAKLFFCRFNDPLYTRKAKLAILTLIADGRNFRDIINELSEYVKDNDIKFARLAISSVGQIGVRVGESAEYVLGQLLGYLDYDVDTISAETIVALTDILRKYPECCEDVIPGIKKAMTIRNLETDAKCSLIWVLGEFGKEIDDSAWMLESFVDKWESEKSSDVRLALLSASVKLFFVRAPQVKPLLGTLLAKAIEDTANQDVHDRALLYYRLLSGNVYEAQRVAGSEAPSISEFLEDADDTLRNEVLSELNTLAVIYGKPARLFLASGKVPVPSYTEHGQDGFEMPAAAASQEGYATSQEDVLSSQPPSSASFVDLTSPSLQLTPSVELTPNDFQSKWGTFADAGQFQGQCAISADVPSISSTLSARYIRTLASGNAGPSIKFYLYAQSVMGSWFLVELIVFTNDGLVASKLKSDNPDEARQFLDFFKSIVAQ